MTDKENRLIERACEWLNTHDSYATPTNVMVDELRKYLTDSMQEEECDLNINTLTWEDIRLIAEIGMEYMNSEESDNLSDEDYYQNILNRVKAQKGKGL